MTITDVERTIVPEVLAQRVRDARDRTAVVANDGRGAYRGLTFGDLQDAARALAARIPTTARVGWVYGNAHGLLAQVIYHAVCHAGAVNVPVNPASSDTEIAEIFDRAGVSVVFAPQTVARRLGGAERSVMVADDLQDLTAFGHYIGGSPWVDPDDVSVVLFTSGTTGRSKGVMHSHRTALAAGAGWRDAFRLAPGDVYQSMFPAYSGASLHFSGLACLLAGATYVIDEPRPTSASLHRIAAWGATVYAAVPSVYQYWLAEDLDQYDLSSLRMLDFGGSVMHRTTIEALREALPGVELVQTYGLTEAGPGGLYLPPEHLDAKIGSIGSVGSGGLRFRLDTTQAHDWTSVGERESVGELQFSGPSLMLGYLDDPESTAKVRDGQWMRTGDLVRIDEDGFAFFVDRLKDLIIRGGFNIASIEVEEVLLACDGVRQAAVFGVPHDTLGEVVGAAVVPDDEKQLDLRKLRKAIAERLPRVKVPEWIVVLDGLPVSSAGKVLKTRLRAHPDLTAWKDS